MTLCIICDNELTPKKKPGGEPKKYCNKCCQDKAYRLLPESKKRQSAYMRKYRKRPYARKAHREEGRLYRMEKFSQALTIVANGLPVCILKNDTCKGQLVIDHIKGDGIAERTIRNHNAFYRRIVDGRRKTHDLRILCHSHNLRTKTV